MNTTIKGTDKNITIDNNEIYVYGIGEYQHSRDSIRIRISDIRDIKANWDKIVISAFPKSAEVRFRTKYDCDQAVALIKEKLKKPLRIELANNKVYVFEQGKSRLSGEEIDINRIISVSTESNVLIIKKGNFSSDTLRIQLESSIEARDYERKIKELLKKNESASLKKDDKEVSQFAKNAQRASALFGINSLLNIFSRTKNAEHRVEPEHSEPQMTAGEMVEKLFESGSIKPTYETVINYKTIEAPHEYQMIAMLSKYAKSPLKDTYPSLFCGHNGIDDPRSIHEELIADGYLVPSDPKEGLMSLKVTELKAALESLGINASGKKDVLVENIIKHADSEYIAKIVPKVVYVRSTKGDEFIRAHQDYYLLVNYQFDVDICDYEAAKVDGDTFVETLSRIYDVRNWPNDEFYKKRALQFERKGDILKAEEKEAAKQAKKKKQGLTESEKIRLYKQALRNLYEGLKGADVREYISTIKSISSNRAEFEKELREVAANAYYC